MGVLATVLAVAACAPDGQDSQDIAGPAAFPEGTFSRTMTYADASAAGLSEDVTAEFLGSDGRLDVELTFDDGRWQQTEAYEPGLWGVGDFGTYEVEGGTVTLVSENTDSRGLALAFDWTFDDGTLALRVAEDAGPVDDGSRFMTEGSYRRESAASPAPGASSD